MISLPNHTRSISSERQGELLDEVERHLRFLTETVEDRAVGSPGNQAATDYAHDVFSKLGWAVEEQTFEALDWEDGVAAITVDDEHRFGCSASPYSDGCDIQAPLVVATNLDDVRQLPTEGALLLLTGPIAQAPLLPKSFPFYKDDAQQDIIAALEASGAQAVVTATSGAPMIEDGDFGLPAVFVSEAVGHALIGHSERHVRLVSSCRRQPSAARNIIARINAAAPERIVITAHIDAKKGVPGALDNATGVTMLFLLAKVLAAHTGSYAIELVALNGEDHYAVPGQLAYLQANPDLGSACVLNVNIDGIGYREGKTAYSFFQLRANFEEAAKSILTAQDQACEGIAWAQGDHSMFVQAGCQAIAVTSNWFLENMFTQTITHSQADTMSLVHPEHLLNTTAALKRFIEAVDQNQH